MVSWQGEAATISAKRIDRALREIDATIPQKKLKAVQNELAEVLKINLPALEQAIQGNKWKLSDLVIARYIENRTSEPFSTVLNTKAKKNWTKLLEEKKIPFPETLEYLDETQAKIALVMIEHRFGKD